MRRAAYSPTRLRELEPGDARARALAAALVREGAAPRGPEAATDTTDPMRPDDGPR
jgi:hypothetical protein